MAEFEQALRRLTTCKYIYLGESGTAGLGIFAARRFAAGSLIVVDEHGDYYDDALTEQEVLALGFDLSVHCLQIDADLYLLPNGNIDDVINHSCEPTAGIRLTANGHRLIALREIAPGDELTYDYSTYITNAREHMDCACGAATCRGRIGPFRDLPLALRLRYVERGVVGAFAVADARSALALAS